MPQPGLEVAAKLRPGHVVAVVDLSASGARFEAPHRLLPGQLVDLQLTMNGRLSSIRGVALRVEVSRLRASRVWYAVAVAFDRRLTIPAHGRDDGHQLPSGVDDAGADSRATHTDRQ